MISLKIVSFTGREREGTQSLQERKKLFLKRSVLHSRSDGLPLY